MVQNLPSAVMNYWASQDFLCFYGIGSFITML